MRKMSLINRAAVKRYIRERDPRIKSLSKEVYTLLEGKLTPLLERAIANNAGRSRLTVGEFNGGIPPQTWWGRIRLVQARLLRKVVEK